MKDKAQTEKKPLIAVDLQRGVSLHDLNKHQLEYSIWSTKVSWCPICMEHFYNDRNKTHTTEANLEHFHILETAS